MHALLDADQRVRVLVRNPAAHPFDTHPSLDIATGDVLNADSLMRAMAGVDAVVHLAAAKNDEKDIEEINVGGARNLAEAAKTNYVKRIVNISTQSAKLEKAGLYGSTKLAAEEVLQTSGVPVVTLRPSLVYGDEMSGVFGTIVRYSNLPVVPVIGRGDAHFRPIHRDDLAQIIVQAVEIDAIEGQIFDVGGPDSIALNDIVRGIMNTRRIRRPIAHLPAAIGLIIARALSFLPHPPITVSNVLGSTVDVPMDMGPFARTFGNIHLRSFEQGLLDTFQPPVTPQEKEADALLRYVLSGISRWRPHKEDRDHYMQACDAFGLSTALIDTSVIQSRVKLIMADTASSLLHRDGLLRKKLLIAAAIAEASTASADALLPKDKSVIALGVRTLLLGLSGLAAMILSIPLFMMPSTLKRYAGTV